MLPWHVIEAHARRNKYLAAALVALRAADLDSSHSLAEAHFSAGNGGEPLFLWSELLTQHAWLLRQPRTGAFVLAAIRAYCGEHAFELACKDLGFPKALVLEVLVWDGGLDPLRSAAARTFVALLRSDSEDLLAKVKL